MAAESRFFFLPFRPILEPADARALKAAISAQIWKVSLVFKEKMISDSDETMIRRCAASAFFGYPHSSDHSTHLGPSVYVLIHFHPSLHLVTANPRSKSRFCFRFYEMGITRARFTFGPNIKATNIVVFTNERILLAGNTHAVL